MTLNNSSSQDILGLDIGTKRIGVARANSVAKIPEPLETINVNGDEVKAIEKLIDQYGVETIVIGLPRNQSGEETEQSRFTRSFASKLNSEHIKIAWQDESLTSVNAEEKLRQSRKNYSKGDVDALAATAILEDYLRDNE